MTLFKTVNMFGAFIDHRRNQLTQNNDPSVKIAFTLLATLYNRTKYYNLTSSYS